MPDSGRSVLIDAALDAYEGPLLRFASRMLGDLEAARDVVQDTFLQLCRQDVERLEGRLREWLFAVCRNRAIDHLRKEGRMTRTDQQLLDETCGVEGRAGAEVERHERAAALRRRLAELPARDQRVLRLKFEDGLSYQDIAASTGLSVSHVGVILHKALKRLRERLRHQEGSLT